ncbi:MAG: TMEM165/GDT1 family protein [Aphanocapsa sp. GSE-SYN-MK-11-07L]|jgi:putative Ca2+/H+ antiporter (TMEM165/GDT1 family)|nr:TMEM165/GDT1 family protein [Aphanocapsa sp. GSE-SYN-MK-11-07L]
MLNGFTAGLLLITVSELGDKSFFIVMLLAMRHPRHWVFIGAIAALSLMTVVSVLMGKAIRLLPQAYTHYGAIALFCLFGLKLLWDASQMPAHAEAAEVAAATVAVEQADAKLAKTAGARAIILEAAGLTFLTEWGDRTQLATITLAAANHPIGVTAGAILGHAICTLIAIVGGSFVAGRISERLVTAIGGGLFLVFGFLTWQERL